MSFADPTLHSQSTFYGIPRFDPSTFDVHFGKGKISKFPVNTPLADILAGQENPRAVPVVGASINGIIYGLADPISVNVHDIRPIYLDSARGADIYRRTLTFLCGKAAAVVFPKRHFTIGHSLGSAYYFQVQDGKNTPISEEALARLEGKMTEFVKRAVPIVPMSLSWKDAVRCLQKANITEALKLIQTRNTPVVPFVECDGFFHPAQGAYLDNTCKLTHFKVLKYGDPDGFLLLFPHTATPTILPAFEDQPKLFATFQKTQEREEKAGVVCVGDVNKIVRTHNPRVLKDFVVFCEATHDRTLVEAATDATKDPRTKLILIAGPSSSGKTTFARKLCVQLRVFGRTPVCVSLDDFYKDLDKCPILPDGTRDIESINALDLDLLDATLRAMMNGESIYMPHFNFVTQKSEREKEMTRVPSDAILVIEGIHALNPSLIPRIDDHAKFKIFISALTRLNLDEHHRVPTTDNRLIRRIVRDFQTRGRSAASTIKKWPSVRKGEVENIFPYQNEADLFFNSSLEYELNALKTVAYPLLRSIVPLDHAEDDDDEDVSVYTEAQRLLTLLDNFDSMSADPIPSTALVREFIGGTAFPDP